MTGSKENILKALDAANRLDEIKAQAALLSNPGYIRNLHDQIRSLTAPSSWTQMQKQMEQFAKPPFMAEMRKQMEAIANPSYLKLMRERMAVLGNSSMLSQIVQQWETVANPPNLKKMREQMTALAEPSYFIKLQAQLSAAGSTTRMQAQLSAVVSSYNELIESSALAKYFAATVAEGASAGSVIDAEIVESIELQDFVVLDIVPTDPTDDEIVKALETGDVPNLSESALLRLKTFYFRFVFVWETLLRVVETYTAYLVLAALMSGVTVPADVSSQAQLLGDHERLMLADYRMVNRNGARLRAAPATSSEALLTLPLGTPMEVIEKGHNGWFHVLVDFQDTEVEGWIYVSVTTAVPAPRSIRQLAKEPGMK